MYLACYDDVVVVVVAEEVDGDDVVVVDGDNRRRTTSTEDGRRDGRGAWRRKSTWTRSSKRAVAGVAENRLDDVKAFRINYIS